MLLQSTPAAAARPPASFTFAGRFERHMPMHWQRPCRTDWQHAHTSAQVATSLGFPLPCRPCMQIPAPMTCALLGTPAPRDTLCGSDFAMSGSSRDEGVAAVASCHGRLKFRVRVLGLQGRALRGEMAAAFLMLRRMSQSRDRMRQHGLGLGLVVDDRTVYQQLVTAAQSRIAAARRAAVLPGNRSRGRSGASSSSGGSSDRMADAYFNTLLDGELLSVQCMLWRRALGP